MEMIGVGFVWADRDVFLADVSGRVAVGSANDTSPAEPDLTTRVFPRVMVPGFPPFDPADYGLDEPGYFALPAGHTELPPGSSALPPNATITVNVLPFTVSGNTASLFFWNGSGAVDFQPTSVSQPSVTLVIDPNPIGSTGANGGADLHPTYRLDNGGAGVPADGVYLAAATVSVAGLSDSPRIFFLQLADVLVTSEEDAEELSEGLDMGQTMFRGKDFGFFQDAQAYVQENLAVAEPSSLTVVLCALALAGATRRRRHA
jgi:hypothetical protein